MFKMLSSTVLNGLTIIAGPVISKISDVSNSGVNFGIFSATQIGYGAEN